GLQPRKRVDAGFAQPFRSRLREGTPRELHVFDDELVRAESSQECAIGGRRFAKKLEVAPDDVVDLIAPHVLKIDGDFRTSDIEPENWTRCAPRPRVCR